MNSFSRWTGCLVFLTLALVSFPAFSQVSISIDIAPPPLVVEDQPACPDDGLIWTPGYWAYDPDQGEYYWVAGAWVQPPQVGFLWTPPYWGWQGNAYVFNDGYWGPTVGFYGGVNYGHGYWGNGYGGGRWDNGHFTYNTAANNVGHVHNTYADRSVVRAQSSRVSFNGGQGGINARPTGPEQQAAQGQHVQATAQQQSHFQQAAQQRSHQVKVNANKPAAAGAPALGNPSAVAPQPAPGAQAQVKPQGQFTGESAQPQKHDQVMEKKTEPTAAPAPSGNQVHPAENPNIVNEQHAADKNVHENAPGQARPEEKAPAMNPHPAPESHSAQAPGGGAPAPEKHAAAPAPQQGQPHPEAKAADHPQAAPQGPAGGGQGGPGGGGGKPDDKH